MNPYSKAFDAMSPHDKHTSEGMTTEREAYAFDEGAAAERAKTISWLRSEADAFERGATIGGRRIPLPAEAATYREIADSIEQGAHAREKG